MRLFLLRWFMVGLLLSGLACDSGPKQTATPGDFIPEDASVVLKIQDWTSFTSDIENSDLITAMKATTPYAFFTDQAPLLKVINSSNPSLLCVNKVNDSASAFTFISRMTPDLIQLDSITDKTVETLTYKTHPIQKVTLNGRIGFSTQVDSVWIASSSQLILQDLLDGHGNTDPTFRKLYNLNTDSELTTLLRGQPYKTDSTEVAFASWLSLDTQILPEAISATGVAMATDSLTQLLNVFEGQIPQQNDAAELVPTRATQAQSFTFSDAATLLTHLQQFRRDSLTDPRALDVFSSISEVVTLELAGGKALALKSIDPEITRESLARFVSENGNFKEVTLFDFGDPDLFTQSFYPLVQGSRPKQMFQLDRFFVFTETNELAEAIITAYINKDVLAQTPHYAQSATQLSNASSLLMLNLHGEFPKFVAPMLNKQSRRDLENISLKNYPLAALQFSYDRNFAHVNLICQERTAKQQRTGTVSEVKQIKLPNDILGAPRFFTNHRTRGEDIVVQDISNVLYFISSSGKTLWSKDLKSPILGQVQEVDILRNGKKQLAFATQNKLHVIDRNGNPVAPFPLNFKDDITQAVSIFDYDRKRNYRFVITQGDEVLMYNNQGKIVSGFTFKKAGSEIVLPPQHIRTSGKDYILIAEESGKLNILSRVGKDRIKVNKKFKFTNLPIAQEGQNFVVITQDNTKESIDQKGTVVSRQLDVSQNYSFTVRGATKVTLDDNLLRINGKLVELPFGIYTRPKVFVQNRKTYIAVTETQEHKVYLYDRDGGLLAGFPVYGNTTPDLGDANRNKNLNILTQGDTNSVLLYEIQ